MSMRRADPLAPPPRTPGFTLLEVMLAVAIVALVMLAVMRFVETNVLAMRLSAEVATRRLAVEGLLAVVRRELADLPATRQGAILGQPHLFGELPSDELEWVTGAGNGLFTRHAAGEYRVTLQLAAAAGGAGYDLGLKRLEDGGDPKTVNWLPLLRGVAGFEVRYFDRRLNAWVEKWTDQVARPSLVRVKIWDAADPTPHEAVLPLPGSALAGMQGGGAGGTGDNPQGGQGEVRVGPGPKPAPGPLPTR